MNETNVSDDQPHIVGRLRIAIQGVAASFHDVATRKYFKGNVKQIVECATFKILCERLQHREADFALMAIENTIAGSILTNYSLLEQYQFKVLGEVYLPIALHLMALPGQHLEALRFVQSHPMALFQCEDFLFQNKHLKVLEANDTAESAKEIAERKLLGYAAIASDLAAATYGLDILRRNIETNKSNYTRFLVVGRDAKVAMAVGASVETNSSRATGALIDASVATDFGTAAEANKASLRFETANEPGSLVGVLEVVKAHGLNLTKIQSVPILGKPYQYSIHVDAEWSTHGQFDGFITQLTATMPVHLRNLRVLGIYRKAEGPTI